MADHLVRNVGLWMSKRPQAAIGAGFTLGTDYLRFETDPAAFIMPRIRYRNNAGRVGRGHEFATKQCAEVLEHSAFTIAEEVNSTYAGRLALRSVGGAVTDTQQGGTAAWMHSAKMLDARASRQLPLSSMVSILGGANYRLDDFVVDRFRLEQTRNEAPRYSCDLIGTGKFAQPNGIDIQQVETATALGTVSGSGLAQAVVTAAGMQGSPRTVLFNVTNGDTPTVWAGKARAALQADVIVSNFFIISGTGAAIVLTARLAAANDATMNVALDNNTSTGITPAATSANTTAGAKTLPDVVLTTPCFDGNLTEIFWTDQNGLQTLNGSGCTIMSWSIETANGTRLNDRCPGNPTVTITDGALTTTPSYPTKMKHGERAIVAQVTVLLDDLIPDWFTYATNDVLTDVAFRPRGPIIASSFRHSLAEIMPKARISDFGPTEVDGEAAMQMTLEPFWDDTTVTPLRVEVVNTDTGSYD